MLLCAFYRFDLYSGKKKLGENGGGAKYRADMHTKLKHFDICMPALSRTNFGRVSHTSSCLAIRAHMSDTKSGQRTALKICIFLRRTKDNSHFEKEEIGIHNFENHQYMTWPLPITINHTSRYLLCWLLLLVLCSFSLSCSIRLLLCLNGLCAVILRRGLNDRWFLLWLNDRD